jgi:hypothetical protein
VRPPLTPRSDGDPLLEEIASLLRSHGLMVERVLGEVRGFVRPAPAPEVKVRLRDDGRLEVAVIVALLDPASGHRPGERAALLAEALKAKERRGRFLALERKVKGGKAKGMVYAFAAFSAEEGRKIPLFLDNLLLRAKESLPLVGGEGVELPLANIPFSSIEA